MEDIPFTTQRTTCTRYSGRLTEEEVRQLICTALCRKLSLNPDSKAVSFEARFTTDSGGLTQKKYLEYTVSVDHTKES